MQRIREACEVFRCAASFVSAQCQCRVLPCCAPDEPCECRECGCTASTSSRPFQAMLTCIAISCALLSTLTLFMQKHDNRVIVYEGFTRTHDELMSKFDIPDQDAWGMHFAGRCARAVTDQTLRPMQPLGIDMAYELIVVLPHMWWRKVCGALDQTQGCGHTQGLYWFSKHHRDHPNCSRDDLDPSSAPGAEYFVSGHPASRWLPPGMALKAHYRSLRPLLESQIPRKFFKALKPKLLVVITNIPSPTRSYAVLSRLEVRALAQQIREAAQARRREAEIIYIDSLQGSEDSSPAATGLTWGARVHSKLAAEAESTAEAISFQEVQLRLMAHSSCFVAPHGGANYLSLYFGQPTVLLHPSAETADSRYGIKFAATLPLLGGSRVVAVSNATHMNEAISELISSGDCDGEHDEAGTVL